MLDIGYRSQSFTIELQTAAFSFLLANQQRTQKITKDLLSKIRYQFFEYRNIYFCFSLAVISPIVQSGEGALQKISRISSNEYRQRLFEIIKTECKIDEPNDDMIDFYSIMIRMDQGKTRSI